MNIDVKNIHIGTLLQARVREMDIQMTRICNFLHCSEKEVADMYESKGLNTDILLRWSKLLEYDFFRLYTQHLILFSPPTNSEKTTSKTTVLPHFRKNIYTREIIDFILELVNTGQKTKLQIQEEYRIPRSTLHKWINKYNKRDEERN